MENNLEQIIEEKAQELAHKKIREANNAACKKFRDSRWQMMLTFDKEVQGRIKALGLVPTTWAKQVIINELEKLESQNK